MADMVGRFCWYELAAADSGAAARFYGAVMGWGVQDGPVAGSDYRMFTSGGQPVAGLMPLPDECRDVGMAPFWSGYVAVADVDATAALAQRLGGAIRVPGTDIPQVGRFAVLTDPQGAVFGLFGPDQPPEGAPPQAFVWHELQAADWRQSFDFYRQLFGWEMGEALDMGDMGTYQIFTLQGTPMGGMFNKPPMVPRPFWLFYAQSPDVDTAMGRALAGGAQVLLGPSQVPGGGWIIQGKDPQGALFALHGARNEDRSFLISRTFAASPERLFDAWTDVRQLARWFGPKGFTNPVCEADPRPGGAWRIVMRSPDGQDYPAKGVYAEVARPTRLVMTDDCCEHPQEWLDQMPDGSPQSLSTVSFEPEGTGTRLTIRTLFDKAEIRDANLRMGMQEGWSESLDRLEELLRA